MTTPGPMKPPTRTVPTTAGMLRFVLGEDAKAGTVLDLDLNTGRVVPARLAPLGGSDDATSAVRIPAEPPPGLFLRALIAAWRSTAAATRSETPGDPTSESLAAAAEACAAQLRQCLDMMGVASDLGDTGHVAFGTPDEAGVDGCVKCGYLVRRDSEGVIRTEADLDPVCPAAGSATDYRSGYNAGHLHGYGRGRLDGAADALEGRISATPNAALETLVTRWRDQAIDYALSRPSLAEVLGDCAGALAEAMHCEMPASEEPVKPRPAVSLADALRASLDAATSHDGGRG